MIAPIISRANKKHPLQGVFYIEGRREIISFLLFEG